ncbi:MAG TPA: thioesterase family protein [Acidimicrobiia bacterium]|nr:thioesterase family protein [Acidimicrobiia bacterium]
MTRAYYQRLGEWLHPTGLVAGPWHPDLSHAGPPAALVMDAIAASDPSMGISRVTFEIPRGIPLVPCRVTVSEKRSGRKIRLLIADLIDEAGESLMSASAWLIRTGVDDIPSSEPIVGDLPDVDSCSPLDVGFLGEVGYFGGVEMRTARGHPFKGGHAAIWIRRIVPLIDGEESDPYADCALFGDLGNGISFMEPPEKLIAVNTDLTLYLSRQPRSEWIAIDARTVSHGLGLGMTASLVYDAHGFVGTANQSIFFDRP